MKNNKRNAGLGYRIAESAAWTISLRVALRILGVLSTVILARLLVPEDFGLVALATLISAGIELVTGLNFQVWLIRHPAPDRSHYDTVWTLSILRGAATCIGLFALAHPAAIFFEEARLEAVIQVLASIAFVAGFQNVGIIDFQKHLRFDKDFKLLLGARVGAITISIMLAWWLRDYRALVGGLVAAPLLMVVLSYFMHSYRPGLSLERWREAFRFSKWLLAGDLFLFLYSRADNFLLGKLAATGALGIYTLAHEIASLASSELVMPIRRVLIPGYSKMIEDSSTLRAGFIDGFALILMFGLPLAAGLGLVADPLIRTAVGDKWLAAIPILQVLAIYGMTSVASANLGPVLIALGRTQLLAAFVALGFVILVPAFVLAYEHFGLVGGAWAVSITDVIVLAVGLRVTLRIMGLRIGDLLAPVARTLFATLTMAIVVIGIQLMLVNVHPGVVLIVSVIAGAMTYLSTLTISWALSRKPAGPEKIAFEFCKKQWGSTP